MTTRRSSANASASASANASANASADDRADAGCAPGDDARASERPRARVTGDVRTSCPMWHVKNHPMSGITPWALCAVLRRWGGGVDARRSAGKVAFLWAMSWANACAAIGDWVLGVRWRRTRVRDDPVIIVGHPRTGTTHLHNVLARDEGRFGTCTTFDVGFPSGFLTSRFLAPLMEKMMDDTRPMDNMALTMSTPQEDELATNQLSAGASPYSALMFMTEEPKFRKYIELREDHEEYPIEKEELERWRSAFMTFVRKLQYKCGEDKRLLLKSPVHAARIRLLRSIFPRAQFVFISRHPYEVFQSTMNMVDKYYWQCYFKEPTQDQVLDYVLTHGEMLHNAYVRDSKELPADALYEVRFDDLDTKPLETMRKLYEHFEWDGFDENVAPTLRAYTQSLADFKKNKFEPLSDDAKKLVQRRWHRWFTDLNYQM